MQFSGNLGIFQGIPFFVWEEKPRQKSQDGHSFGRDPILKCSEYKSEQLQLIHQPGRYIQSYINTHGTEDKCIQHLWKDNLKGRYCLED